MKRAFFFLSLLTLTSGPSLRAEPPSFDPGEILAGIKRVNTLGCVLYVAAHPDDENTRMLAWLSKGMKLRTCYLSLTRGDGGQNLIGTEQGDALGIVRTQELLSARKIDGAEQYFTRAVDFGYSRNPEETLSKWDEETILSDVIWVIRNLRPDVIVTRFPATGEGGHGHHTASAILANKAFRLAGKRDAFPEQLEFVEPWQASRIFFNSFNFRSRPTQDYTGQIHVEVGSYDPLLGMSYGEIASLSRSQHKSQGFGVAISRGTRMEHFQRIDGDTAVSSLFEGIDMTWERVSGGKEISKMIDRIAEEFDPEHPYASVKALFGLRDLIGKSSDEYWRNIKIREVNELIIACTGLYVSATTGQKVVSPGDSIYTTFTALNRSGLEIDLNKVIYSYSDTMLSAQLEENIPFEFTSGNTVSGGSGYSTPYWLKSARGRNPNMYTVENRSLIGKAESDDPLNATFIFAIMGNELAVKTPVIFQDVDPEKGEITAAVAVLPAVIINIKEGSYLFTKNESRPVNLEIEAFSDQNDAILKLELPENWRSQPEQIELGDLPKGHVSNHSFMITPPDNYVQAGINSSFRASVLTAEGSFSNSLQRIDYAHIKPQYNLTSAVADLVPLNISGNDVRVAYINGAGDKVAESLQLAGFQVDILDEEDVVNGRLNDYRTVITGIRAFNKNEWLKARKGLLMDYVQEGGNLIVQYNTNSFFGSIDFNVGPYPFRITRDRVTVEETEPEFLSPGHPILNVPNPISMDDFDGWVQERGLYFAGEISDEYAKLIRWNDPGYDPADGAIITCKYGKGNFTYTGISFFRQLPANVQGAYRILTNMIHLGTYEQE